MDTDSLPAEPLSVRTARLRRTFAKGVGRNTTGMERLAINRAARLTALAEIAAENPNTPFTDIVRLDHAASRARQDMAALCHPLRTSVRGRRGYQTQTVTTPAGKALADLIRRRDRDRREQR